jgi:hypothetical protein
MILADEFSAVDLGDERLDERLYALAELIGQKPASSFTSIGSKADVESLYRFLRNARTGLDEILESHFERTKQRAAIAREVIVAHDTTEFRFSSQRKGLGRLDRAGKGVGFLAQTSLVLSVGAQNEALGVIGFSPWVREPEKKKKRTQNKRLRDSTRESTRWLKGIQQADERLGTGVRAIHVEDREGDTYEQLAKALEEGRHFVIRAAKNRRLQSDDKEREYLWEALEDFEDKATRRATLTRRIKNSSTHPARAERTAKLKISAGAVTLRRPRKEKASLPENLSINVVRVYEPKPPAGSEPIEWVLLTSEPINAKPHVEKIVDIYRARWKIEEYFKALKTGCQIEKRQLRSLKTILTALGLFVPMAWAVLSLRDKARSKSQGLPAEFEPSDIVLLAKLTKRPKVPAANATNFFQLIADLGGHWPSNGPPGWLVLYRGYEKFLLAKSVASLLDPNNVINP